jgi:ribosomal protein L9
MEIALALSILASVISVSNFVLSRKDKAVKDTKENHQELIEYQLKELKEDYKDIASDIKDIKKMLDTYKETFMSMIKDQMEEHIKLYHNKEL